mmetsp:Transcript_9671/g.7308  ORF Transcript_9671/g.7308 Transcript_9671/m.7308 type:complete len:98 (+) Transcript_9671:216-509(+)|eukprot:CAMPEP_0202965738 /NCGR_PEP_ID=MMETSP1396-20130829/9744_1 /ASSEMBLY_ACC=CAM_ASM_000872 /TAXON_ID= /ORGANISM="Pseudokeronopsis sp., Strain Brazil" /LENGTH=97 /DNA_ID=CAMNT_0049688687 /DNA_START=119 /DNA_END=412 /DNA_ORIENTATION=+
MIETGKISESEFYVVMPRYGKSLKDLASCTKKSFSLWTVCQIGIQMVDRIQTMHDLGYLHQDIKPDNILIGCNNPESDEFNLLYLIDYGLSEKYTDD